MSDTKFKILKIFQKELSFQTFDNFAEEAEIKADIKLDVDAMGLDENVYLSSLKIHFTAQSGDKKIFEINLVMCGIFANQTDTKLSDIELKKAVQVTFPTIIFPFARQVMSQTALNGGYPNLVLDIIDFETLQKNDKPTIN